MVLMANRGGRKDGRTDGGTDGRLEIPSPRVRQDISPLGPLPKKGQIFWIQPKNGPNILAETSAKIWIRPKNWPNSLAEKSAKIWIGPNILAKSAKIWILPKNGPEYSGRKISQNLDSAKKWAKFSG